MFTTSQTEYIRAMAETMNARGYKYYLAATNYNNDVSSSDMYVFFSREPITADSMYKYCINGGIMFYINSRTSSSSYTGQRYWPSVVANNTIWEVSKTEHVYTNAVYGQSVLYIQPDIRQLGGVNNVFFETGFYVLVGILLITIFFRFFSRR